MSHIIAGIEDSMLERYLDSLDCRCNDDCIEENGDCCGDCPECGRSDGDDRDYEREAEDRAERRIERIRGAK